MRIKIRKILAVWTGPGRGQIDRSELFQLNPLSICRNGANQAPATNTKGRPSGGPLCW